nr:retrotransposon protein [Tanacetum cinerariifolium]
HFEIYVKSKDINLWQVIQNGDFYFEVEDSETKLMKEMPYELLKDEQKKQLGKNNEAKMTLYNALPRKEYERVFMCKTAKEQESRKEVSSCSTIEMESQGKAIEEAKNLAILPLNELVGSLKVYERILENDGTSSKNTIKEKVKSLALKSKVTKEQTSDDSDSQGENTAIDLAMELIVLEEAMEIASGTKAFVVGAWSDREDGDEPQNDATFLMEINSQEVCFKCNLLPDDWIVDSGCTKHMIGNRRLFTSYKAYDDGHVVFGSNLMGKVIGGGNLTHEFITITNVEHLSGLAFNLISVG